MTENNNTTNPPPRKTLTAGKLSLNKPINLEIHNTYAAIAKNTKGGKTSVAVEVKRNLNINPIKHNADFSNKSFTNVEMENRIKLLQNAASEEEKALLVKEEKALSEQLKNSVINESTDKEVLIKHETLEIAPPKQEALNEDNSIVESIQVKIQNLAAEDNKVIDNKITEKKQSIEEKPTAKAPKGIYINHANSCLLYTSDAADE